MKTVIWFFITCIIATFGFFAALSMGNPWPGFAVAFGVWLIFMWNLFPNAKIHTVFDAGIIGRVTDCKVAMWKEGKNARFSLIGDHGEFYCNRKRYCIPVDVFSLNRFEKEAGIRSGVRTHKPKAPFETFHQFFADKG